MKNAPVLLHQLVLADDSASSSVGACEYCPGDAFRRSLEPLAAELALLLRLIIELVSISHIPSKALFPTWFKMSAGSLA